MIVYLVYRNIDMTEGRGPMVFDSAWTFKENAEIYIDSKPGVMGQTRQWSKEKYGDWEIREVTTKDN